MEILGSQYSERIDELCAHLKRLSGTDVAFDDRIETDEIFGTPAGLYRSDERHPRISLPTGAPEQIVAHELLHGILCFHGYPGFSVAMRQRWPYPTDVAREICHCAVHIIIDKLLGQIRYDVVGTKTQNAAERLENLRSIVPTLDNVSSKHWWSIRVACEITYHRAQPSLNESVARDFATESAGLLPISVELASELHRHCTAMNSQDRASVKVAIRNMLRTVEGVFGQHPHCQDLCKKVVITPVYVNKIQLCSRAEKLLHFEEARGQDRQDRRDKPFLIIGHRQTGETLTVTDYLSAGELREERINLKTYLRKPLRAMLDHCRIKYFQTDSRRSQNLGPLLPEGLCSS